MPEITEINWFKVSNKTFGDEKIQLIETMSGGDTIIVVWFKLLCQASKTNDNGWIYMAPGRPYSDEMLATIFNRSLPAVRLALDTFRDFGMIEIDSERGILVVNFIKYQNMTSLEKIQQQNRTRQANWRERQKLLPAPKKDVTLSVTLRNATESASETDPDLNRRSSSLPENNNVTDLEEKIKDGIKLYQDNIGGTNPVIEGIIRDLIVNHNGNFEAAVVEAAKHNAKSITYIEAIINNKRNGKQKLLPQPSNKDVWQVR